MGSSKAQIAKDNGNDHHNTNDVEDIHPDSPQKWMQACPGADMSLLVKRSAARKVPRENAWR